MHGSKITGLPTADQFERAGLKAWPGIEVEWDNQWVRRASSGYTQRANSLQSLDPMDDVNVKLRLAMSRQWFEARDLQPIVRVTPLAGLQMVGELDRQAWQTIDASHLFAMHLQAGEPAPHGKVLDLLDPRFLAVQQNLQGYSDDKLARCRALLSVITVPACGIVQYSATGEPVASSLMAIADNIVITGNVVTHPTYRRKGHAAAMMRTGLAWAYENGARVAALNVAANNPGGQALYNSLGYAHQYDYTYRIPAKS